MHAEIPQIYNSSNLDELTGSNFPQKLLKRILLDKKECKFVNSWNFHMHPIIYQVTVVDMTVIWKIQNRDIGYGNTSIVCAFRAQDKVFCMDNSLIEEDKSVWLFLWNDIIDKQAVWGWRYDKGGLQYGDRRKYAWCRKGAWTWKIVNMITK